MNECANPGSGFTAAKSPAFGELFFQKLLRKLPIDMRYCLQSSGRWNLFIIGLELTRNATLCRERPLRVRHIQTIQSLRPSRRRPRPCCLWGRSLSWRSAISTRRAPCCSRFPNVAAAMESRGAFRRGGCSRIRYQQKASVRLG